MANLVGHGEVTELHKFEVDLTKAAVGWRELPAIELKVKLELPAIELKVKLELQAVCCYKQRESLCLMLETSRSSFKQKENFGGCSSVMYKVTGSPWRGLLLKQDITEEEGQGGSGDNPYKEPEETKI